MSKIFNAIKKSDLADGLAITMSRYDTKCSREQVLGLRPDLRKVDKHLCNKGLKLFLNEHFDYCLVPYFLEKRLFSFVRYVCSFLRLMGGQFDEIAGA